jgi:LacI family transcriptional regulator
MTIHRAISGKPDISVKTRDRILAEIERLGWRPNMAARGLRQGKTFTLGILVSNVAASFLPEILQGVDRTAEEQGYHTFVSVHEHDPARAERHLRALESKGVDGLVYYPTEAGTEGELLNELHESMPVVTLMRSIPGFRGSSVEVDDRLGGSLAAQHLLELGHRAVGFLGYGDNYFSAERLHGFTETLNQAGVSLRPEWAAADLELGDDPARRAATRILSSEDRPTALFCASDRLAARTMQAALALGLHVPRDLSLVGFNGDPWIGLLATPLTTIVQPRLELGIRAAQVVLSPEAAHARSGSIVLAPKLLASASTAPVPKVTVRTGLLALDRDGLRSWLAT